MQRESDLFITSMITDRIGRHGALLPIKVLQKEKKNYVFDSLKIQYHLKK